MSEEGAHSVSVFDIKGQRVRTFGSRSDRPEQMEYPAGIAIDDVDNLYELQKLVVSSYKESCNNNPMYEEQRQKFTSRGELIKCVGQEGGKEGEFDVIRGL